MVAQCSIEVTDASQVGEVRRGAARLAETLRMGASRRSDVAIVATELATNLVRYAHRGRVLLQTITGPGGVSLEVVAIDSGPGISEVHRSMRDGFSTGGTPGNGLGAVRRLSDEFDAYSVPEKGTVIMSRIREEQSGPGGSSRFSTGAVSIPAPNEVVCGDVWRVVERGGELAVMVADGLGHGPQAAAAAELAADAFGRDPFGEAAQFFERADHDLIGSRGAAVACARVGANGVVSYSGVGNIAGKLLGASENRGLPTQNGTVGLHMRKAIQSTTYEWPPHGMLIMHSDGLTAHWTLETYPGLLVRHPAVVAGVLSRDALRGRDDATVVVVALARESVR
jgi:anti-sigma regulatory factor (Ser/Thr protein kinase)